MDQNIKYQIDKNSITFLDSNNLKKMVIKLDSRVKNNASNPLTHKNKKQY